MSRTVSARIPTEVHEKLRERCNLIGESVNDFVKAAIELALYDCAEFDFGSEFDEEREEQQKPEKLKKSKAPTRSQYLAHNSHPDIKLVRDITYNGDTAYVDTDGGKWRMRSDGTLIPIARKVHTIPTGRIVRGEE